MAATAARLIGSKQQGHQQQGMQQQQQRVDPLRSGAIFQPRYRESLQSPMPRCVSVCLRGRVWACGVWGAVPHPAVDDGTAG